MEVTFHNTYISSSMIQGRKRKGSGDSDGSGGGDMKRQNQFSFVERATQTKNNAEKVSQVQRNRVVSVLCSMKIIGSKAYNVRKLGFFPIL